MGRRFRSFNLGAMLLLLFFALTGCDGLNSDAPLRVFFGTNNIRACNPITVNVDLFIADATLAHRDDGSLDCALDGSLDSRGCVATFDEVDDGDTLRVVIDGCQVPEIASLFACAFTEGDIATLDSGTSAACDCVGEPECNWNIFCDRRPSICLADEANPSACEDCFNGLDDNGNGFVDCRDRHCTIADCGYGQTTVTCPSTTSTTTTTTISPG